MSFAIALSLMVALLFLVAVAARKRWVTISAVCGLLTLHVVSMFWIKVTARALSSSGTKGDFADGVIAFYQRINPLALVDLMICGALVVMFFLRSR